MLPNSEFPSAMNVSNRLPAHSSVGRTPVSLFVLTSTIFSLVAATPRFVGIPPVKLFSHSCSTSRFGRSPTNSGISPARRFRKRFSRVKFFRDAKLAGISPTNKLFDRSSDFSAPIALISGGSLPARALI
uniref:BAM1 n=1 Tax=Arundo donax TaxID=35708 RepID=A0A0A9EB49_ARUDO